MSGRLKWRFLLSVHTLLTAELRIEAVHLGANLRTVERAEGPSGGNDGCIAVIYHGWRRRQDEGVHRLVI
jgi:hypothetical protein